ncbi:hypothetical protein [Chryseobacterium sp. PMSZPI]|uniref:hypothetical protein n=1 Tax=Chryseobacterium sp. PMSZPI TaxID=1033900 RepID=UPI0010568729|nr:hypothetical protein [Chryseobacterium sp. PMSZPI]
MKKIILPILIILAFNAQAQDKAELKPYNIYEDKENDVKINLGARFFTDLAYNTSDYTKVKSGAAIDDARLRTSLTYKNWYFYGDFDFGRGEFTQRNLFIRYYLKNDEKSSKSLKLGYYAEPFSMNLNTSEYGMHFITRPSAVFALGNFRALGLTYKYFNSKFFSDTGVFTEDVYENKKATGNQSWNVTGRYVYIPVNNEEQTAHVGVSLRYKRNNGGNLIDNNTVLQTNQNVAAPMENPLEQPNKFLGTNVLWAKNIYKIGVDVLYKRQKYFVRGEYIYQKITKKRDDETLFNNQLGGLWSWTTLKSWQEANPLSSTSFDGGYIELGALLNSKPSYKYSKEFALMEGVYEKGAIEAVARYSYTNLNDIKSGDVFVKGRNRFYPDGNITDYPNESMSLAGGKMHSATVGLNYTFNRHAILMLAYTYSRLDNPYYPDDKNFNSLQARMMFNF